MDGALQFVGFFGINGAKGFYFSDIADKRTAKNHVVTLSLWVRQNKLQFWHSCPKLQRHDITTANQRLIAF